MNTYINNILASKEDLDELLKDIKSGRAIVISASANANGIFFLVQA